MLGFMVDYRALTAEARAPCSLPFSNCPMLSLSFHLNKTLHIRAGSTLLGFGLVLVKSKVEDGEEQRE